MDLIEIFKALGDENRLRIFNLLTKRELCVCEIEAVLEMTQSNASRHLSKLKSSGIIASEKKSQWVYYKMNDEFVKKNKLLYEFLKDKTAQDSRCLKDIEKLNKVKECDFSCDRMK